MCNVTLGLTSSAELPWYLGFEHCGDASHKRSSYWGLYFECAVITYLRERDARVGNAAWQSGNCSFTQAVSSSETAVIIVAQALVLCMNIVEVLDREKRLGWPAGREKADRTQGLIS